MTDTSCSQNHKLPQLIAPDTPASIKPFNIYKSLIYKVLFMFFLLSLSACALMDTSSFETAVPLKPKQMKVTAHQGFGVDLASMLETTVYEDDFTYDDEDFPQVEALMGASFSLGLKNDTEIGVRVWTGLVSPGAKLTFKKLMYQHNNIYFAVQPGITSMSATVYSENKYENQFKSIGGELQLIMTHIFNDHLHFNFIARGNYNHYREIYYKHEEDYYMKGPYLLFHGGLRGNVGLYLGPLLAIPELGFELAARENESVVILPQVGVALGVRF